MSDSKELKPTEKKHNRRPPNAGIGRPAGIPNKVTTEFRDTVRRVLEENTHNVGLWLEQVAKGSHGKDPAPEKALDLLAKLAEFAAPKLARVEHAGDKENPMRVEFSWKQD